MLRVTYSIPLKDEVVEGVVTGKDYDDIVAEAKIQLTPHILEQMNGLAKLIAKRWLKKATPIQFAQRVVSEYCKQTGEHYVKPLNCQWFVVGWCMPKGFAKVEKITQNGEEVNYK